MRKSILLILCLNLISGVASASDSVDSLRYKGEVVMNFPMGGNTPFWLLNNQHGVSSIDGSNAYLRGNIFKDMDTSKRFTWGAGADVVVGKDLESVFYLQQLYAEAKYRCLNLMIGAKEMPGFLSNPELATGNLLFSGNAHPIPQVKAGIFDYADVWFTNGWLGIKGYLSYGKYTDSRWVKNWVDKEQSSYNVGTLYHSKALFLRGGNAKKFPLEFEIGLEMATQFGGTTYYPNGKVVEMPHGLKSFWKALVPQHGGEDTPAGEQANVEGNFLGSWNFAFAWKPQDDWMVKVYYEHMFEDHSMLWIQYPWKDGLWGVEAKLPQNPFVSEIVYEFLYTKDQAGAVYYDHDSKIPEQVSGRDGYYGHSIYNGWQNWGMGIGNPLVISPIYNNPHIMGFMGNRLWGHHLGFKGQPTQNTGYKLLATYQKNWGTYGIPFAEIKDSFNLLAEMNFRTPALPGWQADVAFAMDCGSLIGRNYGVQIRISKTGFIKF